MKIVLSILSLLFLLVIAMNVNAQVPPGVYEVSINPTAPPELEYDPLLEFFLACSDWLDHRPSYSPLIIDLNDYFCTPLIFGK